jgi:hypothetical protein
VFAALFASAFAATYYHASRRLAAELDAAQAARAEAAAELERAREQAPPRAWLAQLNFYRALAKLPPVLEDRALSEADVLHAQYLVNNYAAALDGGARLGAEAHTEDPSNPHFTEAGRAAAEASNIAHTTLPPAGALQPPWAVNFWMEGPFHRLPMLNPKLERVGYAEACSSGLCFAALDVNSGATPEPSTGVRYDSPIVFPPDGAFVPLLRLDREWPDPLAACDGYERPVGLPITVQVGAWLEPRLGAITFAGEGGELEACGFDAASYRNPDAAQEKLVRDILRASGSVVVIPRRPLEPGKSYHVSVVVDGRRHRWTFATSR